MGPRLFTLAVLLLISMAVGAGQDVAPPSRPGWAPGVQAVPEASPALSPVDALKTFSVPPGYRVELVASEPLVQDPVVMEWDPDGRLWVVEMTGFVRTLDAPEPNFDPIGRVVVLEDENGDGRMDRRTLFADGLVMPRALKVLDDGVLVGEPGRLWWMRDTNHDLRADEREVVTEAFGRRQGSVESNANGLLWGLDNWLHTSAADIELRRGNGRFEIRSVPLRGQWGITQDDAGRLYRNTNESALHVDLVPATYFARTRDPLRTRGLYESLALDNESLNDVWPVRPNPGTNRAYQLGIDRPDGTLARFTAVCGPLIYRGDGLPELYGNAFVAEPAANLVSRIVLTKTGTSIRADKAYDGAEFLASTDERFRPVFLANGPDGALYVVDFYRGVIQDKSSTTTYLRDYIVKKGLDTPIGLGRIYRVVHDSRPRRQTPPLGRASAAQLVEGLSHANGWWRDTAQRLLVERGHTAAAADLEGLAWRAPDWRTRLHALWTLEGLDRLSSDVVARALEDRAPEVRAAGLQLAERYVGTREHPQLQAAVLRRIEDEDWVVHRQTAASLGALAGDSRIDALAAYFARHGRDPIAVDIALTSAAGVELDVLDALAAESETESRAIAATMLAATVIRRGEERSALGVLDRTARSTMPTWMRSAVLRGAEVALLNATMPGTAARRGGAAMPAPPCPTCPGARGGPGGEYAFPGVRDAQQAAMANAGRGNSPLRVGTQPAALTTLALEAPDPLAPRAAAVLGRVEWPGKSLGAVAAPLTAEEQLRFDRGREVYRDQCQACHQPDGRGQERVAPALRGSPLALADAAVALRVLMAGKDGPTGLMPPLGASLSDEDAASVMTYVRRDWGQAGTPIAPSDVARARVEAAQRGRPWSDDELRRMLPTGGR